MKNNSALKSALMTTVAAAAFAGLATMAVAQTTQSPGPTKPETGRSSNQTEQKSSPGSGALKYQNGAQSIEKSASPSPGPAAQGEKLNQNSAQGETNKHSAQSERNMAEPGAATHGTSEMNAQGKGNERGAQTESGKAGVTTQQNVQGSTGAAGGGTSRGASAQLSETQRSRIGSIIGKNSSARVSSNTHLDVSVGATVPRDVHVVALPADVVQIVPQYAGFEYVVVGDQILIIDPNDLEIVAVIDA